MQNVSFNVEYWAQQPVEDFITEAAKYRWMEIDARVCHAKIVKESGIIPFEEVANDLPRENTGTASTDSPIESTSEGHNTGESADTD